MFKLNVRYWVCQVLGWGGWTMINLFFVYFFASDIYLTPPEKRKIFFMFLLIEFAWFIIATHLLRFGLKNIQWMRLPSRKIIMLFIIGVTLTGLLCYYGSKYTALLTHNSLVEYEKKEYLQKAIEREKSLNVAGTQYYLWSKPSGKDSSSYKAITSIKKSTGWYRNKKGEWQHEDQRKGRFWW